MGRQPRPGPNYIAIEPLHARLSKAASAGHRLNVFERTSAAAQHLERLSGLQRPPPLGRLGEQDQIQEGEPIPEAVHQYAGPQAAMAQSQPAQGQTKQR